MNSMRNLEKLGILVIVILVVVVGVVAITPGEHLNRALDLSGPGTDLADGADDDLREVLPPTELRARPATPPRTDSEPLRRERPRLGYERRRTPPADDQSAWPDDSVPSVPGSGTASLQSPGTQPPAVREQPRATPPRTPPAPLLREYVVQKGDSFYRIAERELGSSKYMRKLQEANPGIDASRLKPGDKLRLPRDPDAAPAPPATLRKETRGSATPKGPGGTYVVRKGDTLSDIARSQLGSATRWREIVSLNNDVLRGSARIAPGMKLRLPGSPRTGDGVLAARDAPPGAGREYVVQKGDTLSGIARAKLGAASRWVDIRDLNNRTLGGANVLQVGMKLALPTR